MERIHASRYALGGALEAYVIERITNQERRFCMKDESRTLRGWPAVRMFLVLAATPVLTALVMSLPIAWLVNHVFAIDAIRAIFGVEHLGYWQAVGLFALWYAARTKIKVQGPSK